MILDASEVAYGKSALYPLVSRDRPRRHSAGGGKNASLGEMYRELTPKGVKIPNGFAITAEVYWSVLRAGGLTEAIRTILSGLDTRDLANLAQRGRQVRELILNATLPDDLQGEIVEAYATLCTEYGPETDVAVRSSATAEDLPTASFAGQLEPFLNVRGARAPRRMPAVPGLPVHRSSDLLSRR